MLKPTLLAALLTVAAAQTAVNQFPDGFLLGAATAAYQIEGGWNEDGKGENIWDHMLHEHPEYGTNGDNGDVACDSYHKYQEDVQMLKALNVSTRWRYAGVALDVYRFSISWARILPTGDLDVINQPGIDYYNNLIDELLANGIQPMVTMYHWDLPQALQYIGGWPNPILADYFVEYARVLFENFGDRVKWWITFNEPEVFTGGYASSGGQAPSQNASGIGDYLASHTVIRAHGLVYRLYDEQYRATQNGSVGITLNISGREPASNSTEDLEAAERRLQFDAGLYAHPIFSQDGDYPTIVRQRVDANSAAEGRPRSRLPTFTEEEISYLRGSSDFFGVNHYFTTMVTSGESGVSPSKRRDSGVVSVNVGQFPWAFRNLLNWIANEYPGYPIIVTENGLANVGGLNDTDRMNYLTSYLTALLQAVNIDGVPVIGYTAWSLMDNLEWTSGFTIKYGLYEVDFDSPNRTRTPKESVSLISQIYGSREVPEEYFRYSIL
ncbi:myrosinase 1-like isoform X1 [Schistocerca gregaria]|uniref:myrosinase 1-like isoform X1 n=1 Tax=Schistocerca gregaria TaxID=7010 RepID=UPI00211DF8F0|nr:myrosinase 1-like isoform X1 [Schistocerca gregaria]